MDFSSSFAAFAALSNAVESKEYASDLYPSCGFGPFSEFNSILMYHTTSELSKIHIWIRIDSEEYRKIIKYT